MKKWFEVSEDELQSRMFRHKVLHDEPISRAAAVMYKALDDILETLGVNLEGDIQEQQNELGIWVQEPKPGEFPEHLQGYYIVATNADGLYPHAFIPQATVDSNGDILCNVELYYPHDKLLVYHCGNMKDIKE